jgi:hypothetical protein
VRRVEELVEALERQQIPITPLVKLDAGFRQRSLDDVHGDQHPFDEDQQAVSLRADALDRFSARLSHRAIASERGDGDVLLGRHQILPFCHASRSVRHQSMPIAIRRCVLLLQAGGHELLLLERYPATIFEG